MLTTPVAVVDDAGITVPTFMDVLLWLQSQFQAIYGVDIDIAADTQDGQWISVLAQALNDAKLTIEATYHAYSPSYAQGSGLSSVVKINGIRRHIATTGTVLLEMVGIAGTDVSGGIVSDNLNVGIQWQLPAAGIIIPPEGQIQATATCLTAGFNRAGIGTLTRIVTPVPGWQTVTNPAEATPGLAVESDAQLRRRQTYSVANPSQTVVEGIQGAVASVEGVARVFVYENPTSAPDINGIPPYSIAVVVQGGDAQAIAQAIALRKTPGSPTYGTTSILYYDERGIPAKINFFELDLVPITVEVTVSVLPGFTQSVIDMMTAQIIEYLNTLPIGYNSYYTKLIGACEVDPQPGQADPPPNLTYEITQVRQARDAGALGTTDIVIAFNEACSCDPTLVTVIINPTPAPVGRPIRLR